MEECYLWGIPALTAVCSFIVDVLDNKSAKYCWSHITKEKKSLARKLRCKLKVSSIPLHIHLTSVTPVLLDSCLPSKRVSQNKLTSMLFGAKFSSLLFFGISALLVVLWSDGLDKEHFFSWWSSLVVGESLAQRFCGFNWYSSNWLRTASSHFSRNDANSFACSNTLENFRTSRWHFWQTIWDNPVASFIPFDSTNDKVFNNSLFQKC